MGEFMEALGLDRPGVVSLVGGGGKTTLLFGLGRELKAAGTPVVLGTTTRICRPVRLQAGPPWLLEGRPPQPEELERRLLEDRAPCLGDRLDPSGKLKGISPEQVSALVRREGLWVIMEADGSAGLPLKAWASHEPALTGLESLLVVVVGARGLMKPLGPAWIHRPEIFARLTGLEPGDPVTPEAVLQVITGPEGPLARLPEGAAAALLINQTDAALPDPWEELLQRAGESGRFQKLLWGALARGRLHARPLPGEAVLRKRQAKDLAQKVWPTA